MDGDEPVTPDGETASNDDAPADEPETSEPPRPPVDLPADVADRLAGLDAHDLREAIVYAQEILRARGDHGTEIQPGPGEEIVSVTEFPEFLEVVKRQPCEEGCADCPHGPYVYHVARESHADGHESTHWTLVGRRES